jgi:hypothetical protein
VDNDFLITIAIELGSLRKPKSFGPAQYERVLERLCRRISAAVSHKAAFRIRRTMSDQDTEGTVIEKASALVTEYQARLAALDPDQSADLILEKARSKNRVFFRAFVKALDAKPNPLLNSKEFSILSMWDGFEIQEATKPFPFALPPLSRFTDGAAHALLVRVFNFPQWDLAAYQKCRSRIGLNPTGPPLVRLNTRGQICWTREGTFVSMT